MPFVEVFRSDWYRYFYKFATLIDAILLLLVVVVIVVLLLNDFLRG